MNIKTYKIANNKLGSAYALSLVAANDPNLLSAIICRCSYLV
jgi:hypothetical protein